MVSHGDFVPDDSKCIRVIYDKENSPIRVLLYEDWYNRLKPLYVHLEKISACVSIDDIPDYIETHFEWVSQLFVEISAYGWQVSFGIFDLIYRLIMGLVIRWAKGQISLGKFTYRAVGHSGKSRTGMAPTGGGTQLLELPVEG
ncbi:hypothetical protein NGM10_10000 [Halorussus salilacus]|uniref:hypothetical protein n=1 Tax=Halorussus salilacus TaxID=2953750 RepID=UPI00209F4DBF|nr:hypothetical protein [Halorussus salilacus]USZ67062.1 hypothetical protein NGM10_10000 [Halorussus salilacus]